MSQKKEDVICVYRVGSNYEIHRYFGEVEYATRLPPIPLIPIDPDLWITRAVIAISIENGHTTLSTKTDWCSVACEIAKENLPPEWKETMSGLWILNTV